MRRAGALTVLGCPAVLARAAFALIASLAGGCSSEVVVASEFVDDPAPESVPSQSVPNMDAGAPDAALDEPEESEDDEDMDEPDLDEDEQSMD